MHAAVCLLRAGQPRSAGDATKLGQFIGQFSWVTGDPIGIKGLTNLNKLQRIQKNLARVVTALCFCRASYRIGSVVVTAYDFESGHPGSNPKWGLIHY